ncbi:septum formation protein Maf [Ktedonosporobacter rubrisoli]|uniref:dTTP/UTP pyrophosphatase n=1 Tax=Ktedonosporobacter rubrisoli TaxID=2509675 RepID=A0A4P6K2C6_KTERU|nr:Maf family protein [Ktedonosporobacter rubrisoli]QBD81860.1 septum formation protein Maf [Ktedonosporobacter rubrisoli]
MTTRLPLLLASASPRRRQLISRLGLPFSVCVAPADEELVQEQHQGPNEELAVEIARHKAEMAHTLPEATERLVITADTTVLLDDEVLGKPRDEAHARELLLSLRGRWHRVVTGVTVSCMNDGKLELHSASCMTPVLMRPYSEEEIQNYIATGDPMDKAGAYGIQHPDFQPTERISGCYLNVVGLPLCMLVDLLAKFDVYPMAEGSKTGVCPWSERCLK